MDASSIPPAPILPAVSPVYAKTGTTHAGKGIPFGKICSIMKTKTGVYPMEASI
jgi:hypothetical protein